jgi:hypothetical protein
LVATGDQEMWGYLPEIAQIMRNPGRPIVGPTFSLIGYCQLCTRPIDIGYPTCYPCKMAVQKYGTEMPDLVVPLTYAGATSQSRQDVYNYKDKDPGGGSIRRLTILVWMFVHKHAECIRRHSGTAVTSLVTVPSGKNRQPHPLDNFRRYFPQSLSKTSATYVGAVRQGRATTINPDDFAFVDSVAGEHLLVVEDSWVAGNNALGLAIQAKRSGAERVTVLSIARYLRDDDEITGGWKDTAVAKLPFDPLFCPVTRGACPP